MIFCNVCSELAKNSGVLFENEQVDLNPSLSGDVFRNTLSSVHKNLEGSKSADPDLFNKPSLFVRLFPCMFPVSSVYFLYCNIL
jgi:hypothetical protein